jgi:hypothetical protein
VSSYGALECREPTCLPRTSTRRYAGVVWVASFVGHVRNSSNRNEEAPLHPSQALGGKAPAGGNTGNSLATCVRQEAPPGAGLTSKDTPLEESLVKGNQRASINTRKAGVTAPRLEAHTHTD